jgi:hypothetical protein
MEQSSKVMRNLTPEPPRGTGFHYVLKHAPWEVTKAAKHAGVSTHGADLGILVSVKENFFFN